MAVKLKSAKEWEDFDELRLAQAVGEIESSPNLRFFFRSLLSSVGIASTPFGGNAIDTAKLCGRHEVGMELIATFSERIPELYPNLLLEDYREQTDRASAK